MNSIKSHIDFILNSKKWKRYLRKTTAYNLSSTVGINHRLLTEILKLSLSMSKAT